MKTRTNEAIWIENRQRWQIKVQADGERKTFTSPITGTKGKIDAEKKADKWLDTRHTSDVRFQALWADFLEEIKLTTGTGNYKNHEGIGRLWLLPKVGHKKISAITGADWQACVNEAYKKGLSKKSCKNIRASITAVYGYAKKRRAPMDRPEDIVIPKAAPVGEKQILQPDDIKTLFAADSIMRYGRPEACFFIHAWRLIVSTGLRRGELAGLQKKDIENNLICIRRAVNRFGEITEGKSKKARRYFVQSEIQKAILADQAAMLKRCGIVSKWIFPGPDGDMMDTNNLYKRWKTYRKQHGIDSTLHEMRHTLISIAQADVPEQLLKRMVGHTNAMDTFGIYGHEVDGDMLRISQILDNVFDRILKE